MTPNTIATLVLFVWPLAMGCLTLFVPVRRIVIVSIIGGNLFLPQMAIALPGFPNYSKPLVAGLGALIAALILAAPKLLTWKPKPIDLFVLAFICAPGLSSLMNGLGPWDATSVTVNRVLEWGVAYWVGRSLFQEPHEIRELAIGFVVGGMAYAPLCVWESVMSPQLNRQLYGFTTSEFIMNYRLGGWRPVVFMQHGLAVGAWMASSSLVAWILWRSKSIPRISGIPMSWIAIGLVLITINLRSTGAILLLIGLIGAVEFVQLTRTRLALLVLILMPTSYIAMRTMGWEGQELIQAAAQLGPERAGSLEMRLVNDTLIVEKTMQRPVFGWGGWGRWRVRDIYGNDITISDSWWGILLGTTGVFGLTAAYGTFVAPIFILIRRKSKQNIFEGANGAAWAIGFSILLFVLDTLANAMPNSSFMLAAGVMSSFVMSRRMRPTQAESKQHAELDDDPPPRPRRKRPVDLR